LATRTDRSVELLTAGAAELARPLGLAGAGAAPIASAPPDRLGRLALEVACGAARGAAPPAGWVVVPVAVSGPPAHLAVGPGPGGDRVAPPLVELLRSLLATQRDRAALRAGQREARRAAFVRRLVRDPQSDLAARDREAAEVGFELAAAYRTALVVRVGETSAAGAVEAAQAEAIRLAPSALALPLDGHLLLLHPHDGQTTDSWLQWLRRVVVHARGAAPGRDVQAIARRRHLAVAELAGAVDELVTLSHFLGKTPPAELVVDADRFGLARLLRHDLDARAASAFVRAQLGEVIAWDADHAGDLVGVLEAALDFPRHDQAARRCFMHRNTFRHRLRQAAQLVGDPLEDPERRLALHVALKLHRLLPPAGERAHPLAPPTSHPSPVAARPAAIDPRTYSHIHP
jgi:sugar diacid utilization regulator